MRPSHGFAIGQGPSSFQPGREYRPGRGYGAPGHRSGHPRGPSVAAHRSGTEEAAGKDGEAEVGFEIALELIESIRKKEGVDGIHLMAVGWESIVPRLITEAGLLPPDFVMPDPKADPAKEPA